MRFSLWGGTMLNNEASRDIFFHELEGKFVALVAENNEILISQAMQEYFDNPVFEEELINYCQTVDNENAPNVERYLSELLERWNQQ